MQFLELNNLQQNKYDQFAAAHTSGSFLQSWQWGEWQEKLGHKAHRFFVEDNQEILLAAQVIQTFIPRLKKYYLYIPYGPLVMEHGAWSKEQMIDFLISELIKKFPEAIFIRVEPKQNLQPKAYNLKPTAHIQPGKTLVVDLQKPEGSLLAEMHPKTRYNIKVAAKHGVRVEHELVVTPGHGLHLQEVLDLLMKTAARQGYKTHQRNYYKNFIDFFGTSKSLTCSLSIYKAFLGPDLLASALMIDFDVTRTYIFGGTSAELKNVMAPYALHWQAMKDAKNKRLQTYDFWGIETSSGETPGFVRFKLGFGGREASYPGAHDIVVKKLWYNVYNLLRTLNRKLR